MRNLRTILAEYAAEGPRLGDESLIDGKLQPVATERLKADLGGVRDQNKWYFGLCFASLALLYVGCFLFVILSLGSPGRIESAFAVTGLSFYGIVTQMLKLWKEKVASDLMLVLVGNVKPEDLKPILEIILRGLR